MVVCTLCSCYPWAVLGLPPTWYKSFAYRSRAVIEPRAVLREFGLELDDDGHGPRPRQQRRGALHGAAGAPGRHRRTERGGARGAGHPRRHDRRRQGRTRRRCPARPPANARGSDHDRPTHRRPRRRPGGAAQERRAGLRRPVGGARLRHGRGPAATTRRYAWDDFRDRLVAEIAAAEEHGDDSGYYERWLASFERLLLDTGVITAGRARRPHRRVRRRCL